MRGPVLTPEDRPVVRNQFQTGWCHPFKDMGELGITRCGREPSCSVRCRMEQRGDILSSICLTFSLDPQFPFCCSFLGSQMQYLVSPPHWVVVVLPALNGPQSGMQGSHSTGNSKWICCGIFHSGLVWNLAESGMALVETE